MSRVILFGDSFLKEWPEENIWYKLLAAKYAAPVIYYSVGGSSVEHTSVQIMNYFNSNYKESDILIVGLTANIRTPIVHDEYDPSWSAACTMLFRFDSDLAFAPPEIVEHMKDHGQYYKTWEKFKSPATHLSQCFFIRRFINSLPNRKIILSCFEDSSVENFSDSIPCHVKGNLITISRSEYSVWNPSRADSSRHRPSHLCPENHVMLANYIHDCIETGYKPLDYTKFQRGVL